MNSDTIFPAYAFPDPDLFEVKTIHTTKSTYSRNFASEVFFNFVESGKQGWKMIGIGLWITPRHRSVKFRTSPPSLIFYTCEICANFMFPVFSGISWQADLPMLAASYSPFEHTVQCLLRSVQKKINTVLVFVQLGLWSGFFNLLAILSVILWTGPPTESVNTFKLRYIRIFRLNWLVFQISA